MAETEGNTISEFPGSETPIERRRRQAREWAQRNRESINRKQREARAADPERFRKIVSRYQEKKRSTPEGRELDRLKCALWQKNNPEKVKQAYIRKASIEDGKIELRKRSEIYRAKNPDKISEQNKSYRLRNLYKLKEYKSSNSEANKRHCNKRRAAKKCSTENYTLKEIRDLRTKIGHSCAYCRSKVPLLIDHIIPLAKGGSNGIRNIQFLCAPCNLSKSARDPIDFARTKGLLL